MYHTFSATPTDLLEMDGAAGGSDRLSSEDYEEISVEESLQVCTAEQYLHAAHVMLYAEYPGAFLGRYPHKYAIMMQMRFDGTLGFPGGVVDEGEAPHQAATRELTEELGGGISVEPRDHVISNYSQTKKLCLHFYAKKISLASLRQLEGGATGAKDWGEEVLGVVRCPLYTLPNGLGFPAFLTNNFIGNSRGQLLTTVSRRGLLTAEEVKSAVKTSRKVDTRVCKDEVHY